MFLTQLKALSENSRVLKINLIGFVGQSWYEAEDESVTELVKKIDTFEATEQDEIHCFINSQGGNYFAGVHLYNVLKNSPAKIVTKNLGQASSAASVVFMAGDERIAYPGSITMAHKPLIKPELCNSDDLRALAEELDDVGSSMRALYLLETGLDESKLDELLTSEKLMNPDEALANGFVTKVSDDNSYQAIKEKSDIKASQRAELNTKFKIDESKPEESNKPVEASVVIKACQENNLSDFIAIFHDKNFTKRELNDSIMSVKAVKDVCAATNVNFGSIKEHVLNPEKLFKAFASEVVANKDEDYQSGEPQSGGEAFKIEPINGIN